MSWRVVHITRIDQLSLHLNSLKVKRGDDELKIPLSDIFSVVIEDLSCKITSRLIIELVNHNILVMFCGPKHLPEAQLMPMSGHHGQHKRIMRQLEWDEGKKGRLWKTIVSQKIFNQSRVLDRLNVEQDRINRLLMLASEVEDHDTKNTEAQAARLYFHSVFDDSYQRSDDSIVENAALNYGYAVVNAAVARTISAKGLLPSVGIHHKGERNPFNLASDFIEPFRPVVDAFVMSYPPEEYLTKSYRLQLINLLHCKVLINGKMQTVIRAIDIFIGSVIDYFDENWAAEKIHLPNTHKLQFHEL